LAFVGAGLSISQGYRSWKEVVLGTQDSGKVTKEGLVQFVGKKLTDFSIAEREDLLQIAQNCKEHNPRLYEEFVLNEFKRIVSPSHWHSSHLFLWRIPFKSIVTTNFDPCLFDSGYIVFHDRLKVYTIPKFKIPPEQGHLYHLHGLAYKTNPPIENIETIVLSKSEYDKWYINGGSIFSFVKYILENHNILFLGYSFNDDHFKLLIKDIKAILDFEIESTRRIHNKHVELKKHFLIIRHDEITDEEEKNLRKYNIETIKYRGEGNDYSALERLIIQIYEKSTGKDLIDPVISLE
jgi:hypothetical protein